MIYCVVPRELAFELHDPLRRFYGSDPAVEVVVERRDGERRRGADQRRNGKAGAKANGNKVNGNKVNGNKVNGKVNAKANGKADERRKIHNASGRRIGERRATLVPTAPPVLPRMASEYADQIMFVERLEPLGQHSEDLDTGRLVTRLQAGEEAAFTELYLRFFDRVYGYLRVALNDAHEAEDAAQQVFIKVLEALPQYERRSQPFRAWLFRIVRNYAVDHLRKHDCVEVEDPGELDRRREPSSDSDLRALEWMSDSDLLLFIERLPLPQRQVLVLRYMMDLSNAEISQVLERSADSVRQLQHRALRFLEERLEALGREPKFSVHVPMTRLRKQTPALQARRVSLGR